MTEQEYMDSTDLVLIRTCKTIMRDINLHVPSEGMLRIEILILLRKIEKPLEERVIYE